MGERRGAFTAVDIARLADGPGGKRTVLSYLSLGEAEDYRFYWEQDWRPGHPTWLDRESPDWSGDYKLRYWRPDWQAIACDYTDCLLDAGFAGA